MTRGGGREYYETLEKLLSKSLEKIKVDLSEQDYIDVKDYIDHGEYGVGWELLWYIINEQKLSVPFELVECGDKMGLDISRP